MIQSCVEHNLMVRSREQYVRMYREHTSYTHTAAEESRGVSLSQYNQPVNVKEQKLHPLKEIHHAYQH